MDGSSQLGWAWYPDNIQAVINTAWAASQSEEIRTCVHCSFMGADLFSIDAKTKAIPGVDGSPRKSES